MMISVQDFFNIQGDMKNAKTLEKHPAKNQHSAQFTAGDQANKRFQNLVDTAARGSEPESCLQDAGHEELKLQGENEALLQELAVSGLRKMGFPEEEIPGLLEQLDAQTLEGLFAAAIMGQNGSPEIFFAGDAQSETGLGLVQGRLGKSLERILPSLSQNGEAELLDALKTGNLEKIQSFLKANGKAPGGRELQNELSGQKFGEGRISRELQDGVLNALKAGNLEKIQSLLNVNGKAPGGRELQNELSGQKFGEGRISRELQDLVSTLRQHAVQKGDSGAGQRPAGSDAPFSKESEGIKGKEGLQALLARLRGLTANQASENQGKPVHAAGGAQEAIKQSPENSKHFSQVSRSSFPVGNQFLEVGRESGLNKSGGDSANQFQFFQSENQAQEGRLLKQADPFPLKNQSGFDAVRPAGQGLGKQAQQLPDGALTPGHSQILQGLQDSSLSSGQARQAAAPFSQQQTLESNVVNQVFVRLASGMQQGSRSMVINMHPPELGRVKVSLVSDNGRLSAVLHTENQQVQGVLDRNLPQLRQSLQDQGLSIDDLGVSLESGGQQGHSDFEEQEARFFREQALHSSSPETEDIGPGILRPAADGFSSDQGLNIRV